MAVVVKIAFGEERFMPVWDLSEKTCDLRNNDLAPPLVGIHHLAQGHFSRAESPQYLFSLLLPLCDGPPGQSDTKKLSFKPDGAHHDDELV